MIRRAFLLTVAATALILAPSVAMAYNAPGYTRFVTDSTPASGHPIKVHCSQGHSKTETLKIASTPASIQSKGIDIAGTKSMTSTNVAGAVTFNVTLAEAGSYALSLTNAEGALRSSMTVVVHAAGAAAPAATGQLSRRASTVCRSRSAAAYSSCWAPARCWSPGVASPRRCTPDPGPHRQRSRVPAHARGDHRLFSRRCCPGVCDPR